MILAGIVAELKRWTKTVSYSRLRKFSVHRVQRISCVVVAGGMWPVVEDALKGI